MSYLPAIRNMPDIDRPREKLLAYGTVKLTDRELLQVIIGSGIRGFDVVAISDALATLLDTKHGKVTLDELTAIRGISRATACKLLASLELTGRFVKTGTRIESIEDVLPLLEDIRRKPQEHFVVITMDGGNRVIEKRIVTVGTINASIVHPREVFADAITDRAASIVVAHNHPGGTLAASSADMEVTKRLEVSGRLLGIQLFDHVIVTSDSYLSILE